MPIATVETCDRPFPPRAIVIFEGKIPSFASTYGLWALLWIEVVSARPKSYRHWSRGLFSWVFNRLRLWKCPRIGWQIGIAHGTQDAIATATPVDCGVAVATDKGTTCPGYHTENTFLGSHEWRNWPSLEQRLFYLNLRKPAALQS